MTNEAPLKLSFVQRFAAIMQKQIDLRDDLKAITEDALDENFTKPEIAAMKALAKEGLETAAAKERRITKAEALAKLRDDLGQLADTPLGKAVLG